MKIRLAWNPFLGTNGQLLILFEAVLFEAVQTYALIELEVLGDGELESKHILLFRPRTPTCLPARLCSSWR
jgi:hypothetical protein